ncbi:glycosyltransferase [Actinosynnema sp. NPDC050436]|uniref:glycosyltransferase n=1 Tax=Actinosynnema sp. NPDC050436 TaxID=3155659 RepID=UPI0033FABA8A
MESEEVPAPLSYVVPLRWNEDSGLDELTDYLRWLAERCQVVVVDGSPLPLFARHARRWPGRVTHLRVHVVPGARNGKVAGVCAGVLAAAHDRVVVADDDVRYDDHALRRIRQVLDGADLVVPQNYFTALPWHARWDTARTLLNRAFGSDYPGTLGVRRAVFLGMGGYRDDVLFENLELVRTVRAAGGRVVHVPDLFVGRVPPTTRHFRSQRVRQAYDSLAQPPRLCAELAVLPALVAAVLRRRSARTAGALAVAGILLAEWGRRRRHGTRVYPASTVAFAPLWIAERAACAWIAVAQRVLLGGVRYHGERLPTAAHSTRWLRRHKAAPIASTPAGRRAVT